MKYRKLIIVLLSIAAIFLVLIGSLFTFLELIASKGYEALEYSDGVMFSATTGEDYTMFRWFCDECKKPDSFALFIRFQDKEMDVNFLRSVDGLRKAGWTTQTTGVDTFILQSPSDIVWCYFTANKLSEVKVHAKWLQKAGIKFLTIELSGKQLELPANAESIIKILGPPLARKQNAKTIESNTPDS